jgi:mono/diheme cytochrome c family protein
VQVKRLYLAVGFLAVSLGAQTKSQANLEKGKEAFKVHGCANCHGFSGWGGAGARLAQSPITFENFVNYARKPKGSMPPFGNQVSQAEFADMYAYLKSIPPSPDAKNIPLLNQVD